jgi:hypothetical protein
MRRIFSLSFTMNKKNGSGEFLFLRYNLESTGTKIKEGAKACPLPFPTPVLNAIRM